MIQLDKQGTPIIDATGEIVGYNTQAVLKPNFFFLDPNIVCDWDKNTCSVDGEVYYLDKSILQTSNTQKIPTQNEWLSTYGNTIKYDYYTFIDNKNNPSGNSKNIYRACYLDSNQRAKYVLEYSWDVNDNCVSTKSLAPEGASGIIEKIIQTLRRFSEGIEINPDKRITCVQGDTIAVAALESTSKKVFSMWTLSDGNPLPYNDNNVQCILMSKDYDIVAVWEYVCEISFWSHDYKMESFDIKTGESASPTSTPSDTETEYFNGWVYSNGETATMPIIAERNDVAVYAKWTNWLSISVTSQDGESISYNGGKLKVGATVVFDTLDALLADKEHADTEDPTKTWTFVGWFYGVDGEPTGEQITSDISNVQADIEIVAKWTLS